MIFVALDLETTGLSPENDTIIEIAAIRFEIERDGEIFVMKSGEEHSQLIHPGRVLSKEVTMITGITPEMLEDKPDFESVRDRVRDFIGDAVIVGHNVLFDIAMFRSSGIDLSANRVIDTFELSEIFSQDIESLNLGFLANRYGLIDPSEDEHRALTDTRVSIRLLLRYLGEVSKITGIKKQIWDTLISRDESHTLATLSHICHEQISDKPDISGLFCDFLVTNPIESVVSIIPGLSRDPAKIDMKPLLIETHGNPSEEITIIHDAFRTHSHITLVAPGLKIVSWMSQFLSENNIENMISIPPDRWCSVNYLRELICSDVQFERKHMILTLKVAYWMTSTVTGLLDEMKFYGEERNMLDLYRTRSDESHIWRMEYESKIQKIPLLICDAYHFDEQIPGRYTIIKDIPLLEDITRRKSSQEISFDQLYSAIEALPGDRENIESRIHMTDMVSMIRGIYESIPERPTGPLASPPGTYGETYFITQSMLWHRGYKWLIHATDALSVSWQAWKKNNSLSHSRHTQGDIEYIEVSIRTFIRHHHLQQSNINIILMINEGKTKITLIPRDVASLMNPLLVGSLAYGVNISFPETRRFLIREYTINEQDLLLAKASVVGITHIINGEYHAGIVQPGSVILTTSLKHARDIGQELRRIHGKSINILIQGLSGGKGKMLSLFKNQVESTILIGIIDTWRDEYDLWKHAKYILISKLPFDPPTDPYFLARTVGMSNNFSEYSEPIVTIRLNTLIERITSSGYRGPIVTTDSRLRDTEWGRRIAGELL